MASSLQPVFSRSFPGAHLFEVSIVKDVDPDRPFYRDAYFCFVSLTPGVKTDTGGRTFDRDNRITLKATAEQIYSLGTAVGANAQGYGSKLGSMVIFADSSRSQYGNGTIKQCFVSEFMQNTNNGQIKKISISFKSGDNKPIGAFWGAFDAFGVANTLKYIADKCLELEMEARTTGEIGKMNQGNSTGQSQQKQSNPNAGQPQQNQGNPVSDFQDAMGGMAGGNDMMDDAPF